jgi:D-aminoacyl-tRNA deacylase
MECSIIKKMKLIAYSRGDVAGDNIARILQKDFGFSESDMSFDGVPIRERDGVLLVESKESILHRSEFGGLNPGILVVASRHRSESGEPTLTCHVTGNFGGADFGGLPGRLSIAPALYLREALIGLREKAAGLDYQISLEVTHHGPSELPFPIVFVEVGSTEKQWRDDSACQVVAFVISDLVSRESKKVPVGIGFGGPHYAPNFTEVVENVALGHIMPKYATEFLSRAMVEQMISRTVPKPEFAVLDWKGLRSEEKKAVTEILEEIGLPSKRTSELKD